MQCTLLEHQQAIGAATNPGLRLVILLNRLNDRTAGDRGRLGLTVVLQQHHLAVLDQYHVAMLEQVRLYPRRKGNRSSLEKQSLNILDHLYIPNALKNKATEVGHGYPIKFYEGPDFL